MTKRNERTSPRVARIAAKVLERMKVHPPLPLYEIVNRSELGALAASCLTQSPDRPKRAVAKRRAR